MQDRRAPRVRPRSAVTAAIEAFEDDFAFGVVANISDGGACICTDRILRVGGPVTVQLNFIGQDEPVPLECHVVWCGEAPGSVYRYGVQWVRPAGSQLRRLIRDC